MNTSINPLPSTRHPFPAFGSGAISTLQSGGLVLLPTANLWQVVAHGRRPAAVARLLDLCPRGPLNTPELLFPDTQLLRAWCPRIHPTLETLLAYHHRPLTLLVPAGPNVPLRLINEFGEVAVRLVQDSYCYRLLEDAEAPLVACTAAGGQADELPTSFGKIQDDVLRGVQFVSRRRQREILGDRVAVTVRMGVEGLEFVRG